MGLKLPASFEIANRTWHVRFKRMKDCHGKTDFTRARITIDVALKADEQMLLQTFMHEVLHAAAGTMGWHRVNADEHRIDALAALLAQAWQSQR